MALTMNTAWGGMVLKKTPASPFVNTTAYRYLGFYINGGTNSGQNYRIALAYADGMYFPFLEINNYLVGGGGISANTWKKVEIPLSAFSASSFSIWYLEIMDHAGIPEPTVYIDRLELYK
jgi:hypothetical protein